MREVPMGNQADLSLFLFVGMKGTRHKASK